MKLVLLSRDLMLSSRVDGAARRCGYSVVVAAEQSLAVSAVADNDCQLLFVDLQLPDLEIAALVDQVRRSAAGDLCIVACGPHVHERRLHAAREAGCDRVVTRGQFDQQADQILQLPQP